MPDLSSIYRTENGVVLIELKLRKIHQLFNTLDPSPFLEKDMDPEAEEYIVDAMLDIGPGKPVKLLIYLPDPDDEEENADTLAAAIRHYFAYRHKAARQDLSQLFQQGRWSLVTGLLFLVACTVGRAAMVWLPVSPLVLPVMDEGLLIMGWVAMWRPLQVFLYDWWPIRRRIKIMRQLSGITVEIRSSETMEV